MPQQPPSTLSTWTRAALLAVAVSLLALPALAGPRDQARRMHDRLVGVPPSAAVLDSMAAKITAGDEIGAAYEAMDNPIFYNSSLKTFVTPWTNEAQTVFADLNDYTATVIGMIRDDVPFDRVLTTDMVYVGAPGVVETPYSHTDNEHYEALESTRANLADPGVLVAVSQAGLPGSQLLASETAGVLTTRAAGEAYLSAGTNRRMFRFTAINYLCRDLEALKDITRPTDRIRKDISRAPGGDSSVFLNQCTGCHSGMDPLIQSFAYFDYDMEAGRVVHTRGQVQPKYNINAGTFPFGYETDDNGWDNYSRTGQNASIGWRRAESSGSGAKSFGEEIAQTRAFSVCQVEKVFARVCLRPATSQADRDEIERIADVFEAQNHSMKRVFAETAAYCKGD